MAEVTSAQGEARVRFPPPLVFLVAVLVGIGLGWHLPLAIPPGRSLRFVLAGALVAAGLALES